MSSLPDPRDDEIVSAVLDGEATEAERERVMADPVLRARLQEFTVLRDQVAAPVTSLDDLAARRLVAAAVASSPTTARAPERPAPAPDPWWRRSAGWVGSAAAVLAVVAGVSVLAGNIDTGSDDSGDTAASGDDADVTSEQYSSESFESGESDGSGESGDADASPSNSVPSDSAFSRSDGPPLLAESVADLIDLAVVRAEVIGSDAAVPPEPLDPDWLDVEAAPCASDPTDVFADDLPVPEPSDLVTLRGEVAGRSLIVWLELDAGVVVRTVVVDAASCDRVDP